MLIPLQSGPEHPDRFHKAISDTSPVQQDKIILRVRSFFQFDFWNAAQTGNIQYIAKIFFFSYRLSHDGVEEDETEARGQTPRHTNGGKPFSIIGVRGFSRLPAFPDHLHGRIP
jgi:hypothetical protein